MLLVHITDCISILCKPDLFFVICDLLGHAAAADTLVT